MIDPIGTESVYADADGRTALPPTKFSWVSGVESRGIVISTVVFLAVTESTLAVAWINTVPTSPTSGMKEYLLAGKENASG
jgi:hypothetical protein